MTWEKELDLYCADYLHDLNLKHDEPLSRHTSFHIGGNAKRMAFPASAEETVLLLDHARAIGARPLVLGNGTNVLAPDEGLDRLVIVTTGINDCSIDACVVRAGAGISLAKLAELSCRAGLSGLAFAHGIPGSLGGGITMNAGAYGGELKDALRSAEVYFPDGVRTLELDALKLSYRHSLLTEHPEAVVLGAELLLTPGDPDEIRAEMLSLQQKRRASQPLELPSAGSAFKRPAGHFAAALIDQCSLKGLQIGGAQVSEKHAGFIVNRGGATCADVLTLLARVREIVFEKTGVVLEPEIRILEP